MINDTFRTVDCSIDNQEFGIMAGSVSNIRLTSRGSWSFRIFRLQKFTLNTASDILYVAANISVKPLVSKSRLVTIGLSSSMDNSLWSMRYTKSTVVNRAINAHRLRTRISGMNFGTSPMVLFLICDWNGDTGTLVIELVLRGRLQCVVLKEEGVPRDTLLKYGEFSKVEQLYAYTVGDGDATGAETYTFRSAVYASASQGVVVINLREGRSKTDTMTALQKQHGQDGPIPYSISTAFRGATESGSVSGSLSTDFSQRSYTLVTPRADNPIPMKLQERGLKFFSKVQPEIAVESLAELHAKVFNLVIEKGVSLSFTTSQKNEEQIQRIDIKFIGFDADELVVIQLKGGRYLLATSNEYLRKLIHFGSRNKSNLMINDTFRTVSECTDRQGFGIMAGSVSNIRLTSRGSWSFRIFRLQKFTLNTASDILNVTANISVKPLVSRSRLVTIGLSSSMDHSLWDGRYSKSNKANQAKHKNKLRAKISGMDFGTSPMVLFLICDEKPVIL